MSNQFKDASIKSQLSPWIMKSLMTLWKDEFLYPKGTPSLFISPVQNCRKFSAVRGTTSANNSIKTRPIARVQDSVTAMDIARVVFLLTDFNSSDTDIKKDHWIVGMAQLAWKLKL